MFQKTKMFALNFHGFCHSYDIHRKIYGTIPDIQVFETKFGI